MNRKKETRAKAVWIARANNPYYRLRELALPALTSTGVQRCEYETIFLPHSNGHVLVRTEAAEREVEISAYRTIEFGCGTQFEIENKGSEALGFTVMESK